MRLLTCFAVLGLVSACGSTDKPPNATSPTVSPPPASAQPSVAPRPSHDPPKQFTADRGVAVGPDDAVVGRQYAYSYAESQTGGSGIAIRAVDLVTGEQGWQQSPDAKPTGGALRDEPAETLAVVRGGDGKESLSFAGVRVTAGSGTEQDRREVAVGMLDAATGTVSWSVRADLPPEYDVSDTHVLMAGATEHHVVASVSEPGNLPMSLVVDVRARTATWTDKGFLALALDAEVIIGIVIDDEYGSTGPLRALDVASRAPIWTGQVTVPDHDPQLLAPGVIKITKSMPFESRTYLHSTKNGAQLADLPDRLDCAYDQRDTLVCDGYDTLIALDTSGLRELWRLPDPSSNRGKPELHTAFHGLVYTDGPRTPVILDARTGRDVVADATIAPDIVIPGFGLVKDDNTLYAHPATG